MLLCVQHAKSIPRILRHNISLLAVGKFSTTSYAIDDLYEFVSAFLTEDEFTKLYEAATSQSHGFACFDADSKKVTRNFEHELTLSSAGQPESP
jgi:hypothetical protein